MRVIGKAVWIVGFLAEVVLIAVAPALAVLDTQVSNGGVVSALLIVLASSGGIALGLTFRRAFPDRWPK
jgi:hypothetical protein